MNVKISKLKNLKKIIKYDISKIILFEIFYKIKILYNEFINYLYKNLSYFELKYLYSFIF